MHLLVVREMVEELQVTLGTVSPTTNIATLQNEGNEQEEGTPA